MTEKSKKYMADLASVHQILDAVKFTTGVFTDVYMGILSDQDRSFLSKEEPSDLALKSAIDSCGHEIVRILNSLDEVDPEFSTFAYRFVNDMDEKMWTCAAADFGVPDAVVKREMKRAIDVIFGFVDLRARIRGDGAASGADKGVFMIAGGTAPDPASGLTWRQLMFIYGMAFAMVLWVILLLVILTTGTCGDPVAQPQAGVETWFALGKDALIRGVGSAVAGADGALTATALADWRNHVNRRAAQPGGGAFCDPSSNNWQYMATGLTDNAVFLMSTGIGFRMIVHMLVSGGVALAFFQCLKGYDRRNVAIARRQTTTLPVTDDSTVSIMPSDNVNRPARQAITDGSDVGPSGLPGTKIEPPHVLRKRLKEREEEESRRRKALESSQPPGSPMPTRRIKDADESEDEGGDAGRHSSGKDEDFNARIIGCSYCASPAKYACGRCGQQTYCSARCQQKHWNSGHNNTCQ